SRSTKPPGASDPRSFPPPRPLSQTSLSPERLQKERPPIQHRRPFLWQAQSLESGAKSQQEEVLIVVVVDQIRGLVRELVRQSRIQVRSEIVGRPGPQGEIAVHLVGIAGCLAVVGEGVVTVPAELDV